MNYLSPPEVSSKYEIPLRTVQTACQSGRLACEKLGRFYLVLPEDAEAFANRHRTRRNVPGEY